VLRGKDNKVRILTQLQDNQKKAATEEVQPATHTIIYAQTKMLLLKLKFICTISVVMKNLIFTI